MKMLLYCSLILLFLISCNPTSEIGIYNKTDHTIIVECETIYNGDIGIYYYSGSVSITNSSLVRNNKYKSLISIYNGENILNEFGFNYLLEEDIINAIDKIFLNINIYKEIDKNKILMYDKSYFLEKENIDYNKYLESNNIVYLIK